MGSEMTTGPFPCVIPNFIQGDDGFLDNLKDKQLRLKYHDKDNDLYQFHQSNDLKKFKSPNISTFRALFLLQCRKLVQEVTRIQLDNSVDMTASKYEYTDVLLCHDDELEKRRTAFIYYLVPPWDDKDGGTLDLFDTDDKRQPCDVVKSIKPVWNNFVFFEVNLVSFHQVSEILCVDKTRLSINGWFHGVPIGRPAATNEALLQYWSPMPMEEDKYEAVCRELNSNECSWEHRGPPNKRNIMEAVHSSLPYTAKECLNFLRSEPFCLLLAHLTGLDLVKDFRYLFPQLVTHYAEKGMSSNEPIELLSSGEDGEKTKSKSKCDKDKKQNGKEVPESGEKQATIEMVTTKQGTEEDPVDTDPECMAQCHDTFYNVSAGCYTLAHDHQLQTDVDFTLDVMLFFDSNNWSSDYGGTVTYLSKGDCKSDDQDVLLSVLPDRPNLLALAYVESDNVKFIKYANHRARCHGDASYKMLSVTYCEDEPEVEQQEEQQEENNDE